MFRTASGAPGPAYYQQRADYKINLELELKPQLSTTNSIKYSFFIDDVNEWVYNNLEIDIVLDRITDVGINSLRQVEKDFLKHYSV